MKVILEFDGNNIDDFKNFEKALCEKDENFDLVDSILWELDYGEGHSEHPTKYGTITIRQDFS